MGQHCTRNATLCPVEGTATFTTLGAVGRTGPTTAAYAGTTLEGQVELVRGVQSLDIPAGLYRITVRGGDGGSSAENSGGTAAIVRARCARYRRGASRPSTTPAVTRTRPMLAGEAAA